MKTLRYFENRAKELTESNWDYRLIPFGNIVLNLMKEYRKEHNVSWGEYKPVYDKYFSKYHN